LSKENKVLLVREGGGEAGNTGDVAFRDDAVVAPTPLLRARVVQENDGNAHVTVGKTTARSMDESGERLPSWRLI
jgi:hypothetical protein